MFRVKVKGFFSKGLSLCSNTNFKEKKVDLFLLYLFVFEEILVVLKIEARRRNELLLRGPQNSVEIHFFFLSFFSCVTWPG